jgi:hypothetical protein
VDRQRNGARQSTSAESAASVKQCCDWPRSLCARFKRAADGNELGILGEEARFKKKLKWQSADLETLANNEDDAGVAQVQQVCTGKHVEEDLYSSIFLHIPP